MNELQIPFDSIFVQLSAVLGLSLIVERILELAKNLFEPRLGKMEGRKIPSFSKQLKVIDDIENKYRRDLEEQVAEDKAEKSASERVDLRKRLDNSPDPQEQRKIIDELSEIEKEVEWDERFSTSTILHEPAKPLDDRSIIKAFTLQLLGFAAGILLAHFSGIRLINSFLSPLGIAGEIAPWIDYLLTGLLIGGGSKPIHVLIRFITQRKISGTAAPAPAEEEEQPTEAPKSAVPAIISKPSGIAVDEWLNIPYSGGVDRDILEGLHRRKENPNLVVYHHTAMNSKSTFEDVVRVIKSRTDSKGNNWVTGYNCVVLTDGSIHPFCRWDRYGNHAAGHNRRSLGMAFNGNYETDPGVPYSNPDGRFGSSRPTEVQLKAAARVITLWAYLYDISIDFKDSIIPHKKLSSKPCPGSAFPYLEFKDWISFYWEQLDKSQSVKDRVEEYKLKPYLYV